MSKSLEALKEIRDICSDMTTIFDDDLDIIEKELKDFEWLKSKISIDFFYQLSSDDRLKLMEIMGVKYEQ